VKKFVAWIWKNIRYPSRSHEIPFYPNETLETREGDCDDQAILLSTFCRIYGIPAFVQTGCIYLSPLYSNASAWDGHLTQISRDVGWHGWASVYVPPWGWLPVDLTYVWGSLNDPVNSITCSAVTLSETVQYMNICRSDYVGATRAYRDFLQSNGFYLYSTDQMDVTFLGDLNCDFVVNILDIAEIAKAYGLTANSPFWNGMADLAEPYGLVNILDLTECAREFGFSQ
jgi:hypothetical protein